MKKLKNTILLALFHDFSRISILSDDGTDEVAYFDSNIKKYKGYSLTSTNRDSLDLTYNIKYMENRGKKFRVEFFVPENNTEVVKDLLEPYEYSIIMTGRINRLDDHQCRYEKEAHIQTTLDAMGHIKQKISKYITPRKIIIDRATLINNSNLVR